MNTQQPANDTQSNINPFARVFADRLTTHLEAKKIRAALVSANLHPSPAALRYLADQLDRERTEVKTPGSTQPEPSPAA
ncbi:MAG TPA: hypothetical protein VHM70_26395 [Polyangiaceae bacterium]|jgi:hypothetical protein|nr:hypothetical protein [Polyangiaceae bacterium]